MKRIFENAVWWSGVVMVGLVLGLTIQFVRAWTEPTDAPPNGNVGAPINTGIIEQLKQGALGINGLLKLYGGLQMPTGAQPGYVLTADALGNATWQPPSGGGGGISFTYYCSTTWWVSAPNCVDSGGSQGYCPSGYAQKAALGAWGNCNSYSVMGYMLSSNLLPPGGTCGVDPRHTIIIGNAYICSKN